MQILEGITLPLKENVVRDEEYREVIVLCL